MARLQNPLSRVSHTAPGGGLRAVVTMAAVACVAGATVAQAQSVALPAPRLLTTMPMGATQGTQVDVTISGEYLEGARDLLFSEPRITGVRKLDAAGQPVPNQYAVTIAADCPPGLYEARLMTRLGLSSSRIFSVGTLPEIAPTAQRTSLATAQELKLNSVCNAVLTVRATDYFRFDARKGQRIGVDCASRGIDSKLEPVVIIADANGRDLLVERRGGALDFTVPADGTYHVKIHELTYQGGPAFFYRLTLRELAPDAPLVRHPSTRGVSTSSWPPVGLPERSAAVEIEPNDDREHAQKITLPCDLSGNFFPAADVDTFEFDAKKGEEWWVEVASERLGLPTDPAVLVQHVAGTGESEVLTDVAEFSDIASPVKVSSNGYAYDGPPYNAGSPDVLGKLAIQADGRHRLHVSDLFGGTRSDPRNVYRLIIRKAQPDFALVAWPLHFELRNGDRAALSKPISLRGGATMALEVVAIRRDGFSGAIDIVMEGLPEGVTARGLKIAAGASRGMLLVTAQPGAPPSMALASITGRAEIDGKPVSRPCPLATVAWPIPDSWGEIPSPRLMADVPVSVGGVEQAPMTIAPASRDVFTAKAGEKLTIPLVQTRRCEFSGATMQLRAIGAGFESSPSFEVSLTAEGTQAVLDLAALKTPPGEYTVAFQGYAVAKYQYLLEAVDAARTAEAKAREAVAALEADAAKLADDPKVKEEFASRQKSAAAALAAATEQLKKATETAQPRDIVDIIVSEPIAVRILPAESK